MIGLFSRLLAHRPRSADNQGAMIGERGLDGYEVRLKPGGASRFFTAAFLTVWLCGWAAGEAFALVMLFGIAYSRVTGTPAFNGVPTSDGPTLAIVGFLLFWLVFWTLGGILAMRELLRMLWGEDRMVAGPKGLTVSRGVGPFRSSREYPRDQLRRLYLKSQVGELTLETDRATVALSGLGSLDQREEARDALAAELGLGDSVEGGASAGADRTDAGGVAPGLPDGWEEIVTPEGERALVPHLATRRTQARVAAAIALAAVAIEAALVRNALHNLALIPIAIIVGVLAAGMSCCAACLWRGRMEWRLGGGRLIQRRRWGSSVRDVFEARRLALDVSTDSDGDEWFRLAAVAPDGEAAGTRSPRGKRRQIAQAMNDAMVPRRLGAWIAQRADVPFEDHAAGRALARRPRAEEMARLRAQLEGMGGFGRFAARLIDQAEARRSRRTRSGG